MNPTEVDNFLRAGGHLRPGESIFDHQELDVVTEIARDGRLSERDKGLLISAYAALSVTGREAEEPEARPHASEPVAVVTGTTVGPARSADQPADPAHQDLPRTDIKPRAPTGSVFTIQQVAVELQVSDTTVERLIRHGSLGSMKVGRRRLVRRSQLDVYLDHQARVERRHH